MYKRSAYIMLTVKLVLNCIILLLLETIFSYFDDNIDNLQFIRPAIARIYYIINVYKNKLHIL